MVTKQEVMDVLKKVNDPEHPIPITDLNIVNEDSISIEGDKIKIDFRPTVPFCPMGGAIGVIIKYALEKELGKEVEVQVACGSHAQEDMLNQMLSDRKQYEELLERLKQSGLLQTCYKG